MKARARAQMPEIAGADERIVPRWFVMINCGATKTCYGERQRQSSNTTISKCEISLRMRL